MIQVYEGLIEMLEISILMKYHLFYVRGNRVGTSTHDGN